MKKNQNNLSNSHITYTLINIVLMLAGVVLFTLPQPNLLTVNGLPFLIYFALLPVFLLVRRASWKSICAYGFVYGALCYCFYTSWLGDFHPLGLVVIASQYGLYLLATFPILKAAASLFPRFGWVVQWIVWCGYEYIKTLGFPGFQYGVTGYSQWQNIFLMQIADLGGVWLVSALVCFPSALLTGLVLAPQKKQWLKVHRVWVASWCVLFVASFLYGFFAQVDYSKNRTATVALIQPNSDPWKGGMPAYTKDFKTLSRLSDEALAENPNIDFVVWPETSFIPRIEWHFKYRRERDKFELVEDLLHYLDNAPVPYIIGNDDAVLGYTKQGTQGAIDYNSAFLFRPGENVIPPNPERYRKMHLVPYTEHFPYEKQLPFVYDALIATDTHFWEKGTDVKVFRIGDIAFSTPICFEDTFGYISRRFVNAGAQAIVNLTNDAWSNSLACQYQHLSMAVFRSVENKVPTVRSTASGQTAIIDPNGKITAMAEPFTETYLVGSIPIRRIESKTLYTRLGDYVGIIFAALSFLCIAFGLVKKIHSINSKK